MKTSTPWQILLLTALAVLAGRWTGAAPAPSPPEPAVLLPKVRAYVESVIAELDQVPAERQALLRDIAAAVVEDLRAGREARLTFICTHNSRRSHLSQVWLQTAAAWYGLDRVQAYSGGTEVTACNCRTVLAMRRAGFIITDATAGDNPLYLVTYASNRPPVRAYSKHYRADENPREGFLALMTCSAADQSCPKIEGAWARFAIHYADPRLCDDLPTETAEYDARCREIAREMLFLTSEVRRRLDVPDGETAAEGDPSTGGHASAHAVAR